MTTGQLDGFFLVEDESPVPPIETPASIADRRPIDPGYVLTWKEFAQDCHPLNRNGHTVRTGMVLAPAPRPGTVWVIPDQPAAGEGFTVIVARVTAASAAEALRVVGANGDYRSTAGWQRPRTLPRAVLRVDRCTPGLGDRGDYLIRALHGDPECPFPGPFPGDSIVLGDPERQEECYIFDGWLHPWSRLPIDPATAGHGDGMDRYVAPCGVCLNNKRRKLR